MEEKRRIRRRKISLTKEEKLLLLREADLCQNISAACRKFEVATTYYYQIKKQLGDEYIAFREKEGTLGIIESAAIESNKRRMTVEQKAQDTLMRCLEVIDTKMENERRRLEGDEDINEKLSLKDMTQFFLVAAPYIMKIQSENNPMATNLMQHHTYITNILNQQTLKIHGDKQNNN